MKYKEVVISPELRNALLNEPERSWRKAERNWWDAVTGELIEVHSDGHITHWRKR